MSVLLCTFVVINCISWIPEMAVQAQNREFIIAEVASKQKTSAKVRRFSDICSRKISLLEYVNSQEELDCFCSVRMYGTHVILEE